MSGTYDDIIGLPNHVSERHPRMPMIDRAAQFSPFAALTGYDAAVKETARLTDTQIELDESQKVLLDLKLREAVESKEPVRITFFLPDDKKAGGAYIDTVGQVKGLDSLGGTVIMLDDHQIPINDIVDIEMMG